MPKLGTLYKKQKKGEVGARQYNSNNKLIIGQYTSRYNLNLTHTHTLGRTHTHARIRTRTHTHAPLGKSNEVIYIKRWREYRFS